jgi:hypothetical protein
MRKKLTLAYSLITRPIKKAIKRKDDIASLLTSNANTRVAQLNQAISENDAVISVIDERISAFVFDEIHS